jgi:hypothetical protein
MMMWTFQKLVLGQKVLFLSRAIFKAETMEDGPKKMKWFHISKSIPSILNQAEKSECENATGIKF